MYIWGRKYKFLKKRKEFSSRWKKNVKGDYSEFIEILFVSWPFKRGWEGCNEEKTGETTE